VKADVRISLDPEAIADALASAPTPQNGLPMPGAILRPSTGDVVAGCDPRRAESGRRYTTHGAHALGAHGARRRYAVNVFLPWPQQERAPAPRAPVRAPNVRLTSPATALVGSRGWLLGRSAE